MPARATSSATISFGLVTIPVKVYAAVQSKAVHFNMLDPRDKARVKQQLVNANTGEPVERGSTLRGYEYARDQYVVFTEAELEALEQKSDKTIEIAEFVPIERVDPILFEKSNLLGPDKGAAKAYRLLNEAMILTGRVAIGRFDTRGRHQLSPCPVSSDDGCTTRSSSRSSSDISESWESTPSRARNQAGPSPVARARGPSWSSQTAQSVP